MLPYAGMKITVGEHLYANCCISMNTMADSPAFQLLVPLQYSMVPETNPTSQQQFPGRSPVVLLVTLPNILACLLELQFPPAFILKDQLYPANMENSSDLNYISPRYLTSAIEDGWKLLFSPLSVCLFVCVCLLTVFRKNSTDFDDTWWGG